MTKTKTKAKTGGLAVKRRGSSYEMRVRNWFKDQPGWDALRIPLSGASSTITESIGGHDVKAWNEKKNITLICECKKRGTSAVDETRNDEMEIKKEWIDKIDFTKDEILIFATDRSPHYCLLPLSRFSQILGRKYQVAYDDKKTQIFSGKTQFLFKRETFEKCDLYYNVLWDGKEYIIMLLEHFITLRETSTLQNFLSNEDRIRQLSTIEQAVAFEAEKLSELSYFEKKILYQKMDFLENGSYLNPLFHAKEQWYKSDAYICICPHCSKKIIKSDFDQKKFLEEMFDKE